MVNININTDTDYFYPGEVFNFNGRFTKAIKAHFYFIAKAGRLQLPKYTYIDLFPKKKKKKTILPIYIYDQKVWVYANLEQLEISTESF